MRSPLDQAAHSFSEPLGEEQAQPCRSPCKAPTWPPTGSQTNVQPILAPTPPQPAPRVQAQPQPHSYSLAEDDHVHAPEDAHDPAHHDAMAVRIWMRAAAMFSQKTQHTCLSGRSVQGATQHGEGRDERL